MGKQSKRQIMRDDRARRRKQSQMRMIIGMVVAAVLVVGGLIAASLASVSEDAASFTDDGRYEGIAQGLDQSGAPSYVLGDPNAPITMIEYSDFSCGHCSNLATQMHDIVDTYVAEGKLRIVYKPITFVNPGYSDAAAKSAICAGEQGKFWEMHDQIWAVFARSSSSAYRAQTFRPIATDLGLDISEYNQCLNAASTQAMLDQVADEAIAIGLTGTPTVYINGEQVPYTAGGFSATLSQLFDSLLGL